MIGEEITENMKKCSAWGKCSINICPLDLEAHLRNKLPEEKDCPFTIKKKHKHQKGIRTLVPYNVLQFIPKSNVKMLNKRNQRQWLIVHNAKDER